MVPIENINRESINCFNLNNLKALLKKWWNPRLQEAAARRLEKVLEPGLTEMKNVGKRGRAQ